MLCSEAKGWSSKKECQFYVSIFGSCIALEKGSLGNVLMVFLPYESVVPSGDKIEGDQ